MVAFNLLDLGPRLDRLEQRLDRMESSIDLILKRLGLSTPEKLLVPSARVDSSSAKSAPLADETLTTNRTAQQTSLTASYQYFPLDTLRDEIRILQLHGSEDFTAPIVCSLLHRPLDGTETVNPSQRSNQVEASNPKARAAARPLTLAQRLGRFTALSYTWGGSRKESTIVIDGCTFRITKNLEIALRHVRSLKQKTLAKHQVFQALPSFLWVDAICINQDDVLEKNCQVALMTRIYKQAANVIVWLGEEADNSRIAMNLIAKLSERHERGPGIQETQYERVSDEQKVLNWKALANFYCRPWFSRVWVRQEVAVSKAVSFHCGDSVCSYVSVISIAKVLGALCNQLGLIFKEHPWILSINAGNFPRPAGFNAFSEVSSFANLRKSHGNQFFDLNDLLPQVRTCDATEPRDRIFSMLGLVDPKVYNLQPDYQLEISAVFKAAATQIIQNTEKLDILSLAQNPERAHGLPSWAPNLTDSWKARPLKAERRMHSVGKREAIINFDDIGDILTVVGSRLDTIKTICDEFVAENDSQNRLHQIWQNWQLFTETALNNPKISHTDKYKIENLIKKRPAQQWDEFFALCVSTNRGFNYDENGEILTNNDITLDGCDNLELAKCLLWTDEVEANISPYRTIYQNLYQYGLGRRLSLSARGILALIPNDAREDDILCLLHGTMFPFVLRKHGEHFLVVGEAYLPFYRQGEGWDGDESFSLI